MLKLGSRPARPPGRGPITGPRSGSDTVADEVQAPVRRRSSATARRSARRRIVRATSRAALTWVSPGTTNSRGITMLPSRSAAARPSRSPSPSRRGCGLPPGDPTRRGWWRVRRPPRTGPAGSARIVGGDARPIGARGVHVAAGCAGQPEGRNRFVDRAVGLRPEVVLSDPLPAEQEAGRAGVALAGRDGGVEPGRGRFGAGASRPVRAVRHRRVTTSGPRRADPSARRAGSP